MEWKEVRLGNVCEIYGRIGFRGYTTNDLVDTPKEGAISLSPKNIINGELNLEQCTYIKWDKYYESPEIMINPNEIVITKTGSSVGRTTFVRRIVHPMTLNPQLVVLKNISENAEFLSYYIKSALFQSVLKSIVVGSAIPTLSQKNLANIMINVPKEVEDQRRIASILSSLDRKIELNNKINADLEEMAQAIFKNWFVDFEPFKNGKFVDSELGMIPEGWKVGLLGELCNFKRGKNLLTKNAIDEGVPVVAGGLEPSCYHNVANTGAPVITVSGSGANAGFMRMYHVPVWASDCSFIDITCENFYFVYCFLKVNSKLLKHAQTGAVQPHVKPSDIHDFELVIPDKESIFDFQDKVKPFFDKIALIQKENSRLSLLRDTLLPRLMSGEIEVPE
uniref:restriction endonuclease subunit S n=1 Tax=Prevotella sp. TaxID=59823 RepID=UPI004028BB82